MIILKRILFLSFRHNIYIYNGKLKIDASLQRVDTIKDIWRDIYNGYFENHKHIINRFIHCFGLVLYLNIICSKSWLGLFINIFLQELNILYFEPFGHSYFEGNLAETTRASFLIKTKSWLSRCIKANTYQFIWGWDLVKLLKGE